jgi:hypothetical protein
VGGARDERSEHHQHQHVQREGVGGTCDGMGRVPHTTRRDRAATDGVRGTSEVSPRPRPGRGSRKALRQSTGEEEAEGIRMGDFFLINSRASKRQVKAQTMKQWACGSVQCFARVKCKMRSITDIIKAVPMHSF